ncbi:hypothetical protein PPOP_1101 [Paenibacillus popilliae ATCC 14706]|uniref:Uncharacterized protein n=1 Tax=Paenibacillus popilliae ATCC 14706 TaxID=1212764 RepID=M9LGN8_PAEPP|nr:hypothetical protein PPOP_1101 [Paenibacillus popilliae ATCC 14706]
MNDQHIDGDAYKSDIRKGYDTWMFSSFRRGIIYLSLPVYSLKMDMCLYIEK